MKKIIIALTVLCLAVSLSLGAFADEAASEEIIKPAEEIGTLAVCTNHKYTRYSESGSTNNRHKYYCSNEGCNAYEVESCYNTAPCCAYPNSDTKSCQRCGKGTLSVNHSYSPKHAAGSDSVRTHIQRCTNIYSVGTYSTACSATRGSEESCTINGRTIWKGFVSGRGHYLTETCTVCGYQYDAGYHYPPNHANGTDSKCSYCTMSGSSTSF